jgi:hypothetical protein
VLQDPPQDRVVGDHRPLKLRELFVEGDPVGRWLVDDDAQVNVGVGPHQVGVLPLLRHDDLSVQGADE